MPRAPPALADELVEEILLRTPPDDPAPRPRRARLQALVPPRRRPHLPPPLPQPPPPPRPDAGLPLQRRVPRRRRRRLLRPLRSHRGLVPARRGWHALDARAGRVLLHRASAAAPAQAAIRLAVWDPLAASDRGHIDLPAPALPRRPRSWNAALLCEDDPDGPFRVVLVGTDAEGTFACFYSSPEPAAWSEPAFHAPQHPGGGGGGDHVDMARGVLVGDALYFVCQMRTRVLRYELGTRAMSVVHLPPASHNQRIALTTTEDGGLGFARMEGCRLCLWSSSGGAMEWTRGGVIDLRTLLPVIDVLGFGHGLGIILVGTVDGFFSVDRKSDRMQG
ncbi:hypothetical protein PVAP13_6NG360301 [Panicum virgatum]|uniref:F-box protein AT5G49610-like beta-propeller domain-containing protein n=1 Tax=Panicum virgatum TaxID=38727 RepID=A0A8T0R4V3_PANVG|nr:hypothetical protein PVAP13_6NG360301 [Panicum virgatum]